ncbi:hypothetical protein MRX96_022948 [Rhipicephalus microplus]
MAAASAPCRLAVLPTTPLLASSGATYYLDHRVRTEVPGLGLVGVHYTRTVHVSQAGDGVESAMLRSVVGMFHNRPANSL